MPVSFYSFQLHDNALALHEYTRHERKMAASGNGVRFDGELDTFQEPELSSLGRLVRLHCSSVLSLLIVVSIEYGRYPAAMIGYAPSDSLMIGTYNTGICPLLAPSANAKSTVPRFSHSSTGSIIVRIIPTVISHPRVELVYGTLPQAATHRIQEGEEQPEQPWWWPPWRWPCGHSILITVVMLFLGYAADEDDGWIHDVWRRVD